MTNANITDRPLNPGLIEVYRAMRERGREILRDVVPVYLTC